MRSDLEDSIIYCRIPSLHVEFALLFRLLVAEQYFLLFFVAVCPTSRDSLLNWKKYPEGDPRSSFLGQRALKSI